LPEDQNWSPAKSLFKMAGISQGAAPSFPYRVDARLASGRFDEECAKESSTVSRCSLRWSAKFSSANSRFRAAPQTTAELRLCGSKILKFLAYRGIQGPLARRLAGMSDTPAEDADRSRIASTGPSPQAARPIRDSEVNAESEWRVIKSCRQGGRQIEQGPRAQPSPYGTARMSAGGTGIEC